MGKPLEPGEINAVKRFVAGKIAEKFAGKVAAAFVADCCGFSGTASAALAVCEGIQVE
jgi:hypothetical protein